MKSDGDILIWVVAVALVSNSYSPEVVSGIESSFLSGFKSVPIYLGIGETSLEFGGLSDFLYFPKELMISMGSGVLTGLTVLALTHLDNRSRFTGDCFFIF